MNKRSTEMKMSRAFLGASALSAFAAILACWQAHGAVTVTASRDYVDRRTTLHPVTNDGQVVGYSLGIQTNVVIASKEYVDHSGGGGSIISLTNKYPLFVIDLNPGEARAWCGIELKATTNNFSHSSASNMIFFTATAVNGESPAEHGLTFNYDWCRLFVLSKRADSDIRRWVRIKNTGDLGGYAPLSLAIIVDPTMLKRGQGDSWLYEGNKDLTWSYVRIGLTDAETDQDGRQCWRPAMPARWYSELPDWAKAEVTTVDGDNVSPYTPPWTEAIADADTSYRRFNFLTNVNQSVQCVTNAPGGILDVRLPDDGNRTKDWVVYCSFTADTAIKLPAATWWMADSAYTNAVPANQPTALYFTQVTDGVYMLSRQELTSIRVEE